MIKIIKKGKTEKGKEYIVIKMDGDTQATQIIKKFGKKYHPGWGASAMEDEDGKYVKVLYKRDEPLKSTKEIKYYADWI